MEAREGPTSLQRGQRESYQSSQGPERVLPVFTGFREGPTSLHRV